MRQMALGVAAVVVLLTGCSAAPATRITEASVDEDATLTIVPVSYDGQGVVIARFSQPVPTRPVNLERSSGSGWEVVASSAQDQDGRVEFLAPYSEDEYRAVAQPFDGDPTATGEVTTSSASLGDQWKLKFSEGFDEGSLPEKHWDYRQTGHYVGSRKCSAPYPSTVEFEDGELVGSVVQSSTERTRVVKASVAEQLDVPVSDACPYGVWDAAMVTTEDKYTFRYGTVAVRAKFPTQTGVHGSAWLQAVDGEGVEIDFIETFGPKYGIQHKIHYTENDESVSVGGYVKSLPEVKTPEWWEQHHVFSVEWTPDEYVFRVDGEETFRTQEGVSQGEQYIILSLLASDWELKRIDPDDMPASMAIDWIEVWQEHK